MSKEKKMFEKVKKLALKIVKLGAKLDKYNVPFELSYQNDTSLKKGENKC